MCQVTFQWSLMCVLFPVFRRCRIGVGLLLVHIEKESFDHTSRVLSKLIVSLLPVVVLCFEVPVLRCELMACFSGRFQQVLRNLCFYWFSKVFPRCTVFC